MTDLNLYEARIEGSKKVNLIVITDSDNRILAKTNTDNPIRTRTAIYADADNILRPVSFVETKRMYASGESVLEVPTKEKDAMHGGPIFIVSSRKIPQETYTRWKKEFVEQEEERETESGKIYDKLRKTKEALDKVAQRRVEQLPAPPSLEQLVKN